MMPVRFRRVALGVPLLLALLVFVGPVATSAATTYRAYTYFSSAYERQIDNRTCVAASTAMMMNILSGRDLNLNQRTILRYAQERDALNDDVQRGSDPLGWALAASHYSQSTARPTTYYWQAYTTKSTALRWAAIMLARYKKPVGLLVNHGAHAVVMTGFTSSGNPLQGEFTLTGIYYSDPLGTHNSFVSVTNAPLNSYTQTDATPEYDKAWYGKYIVIVPRN